MDTVTDNKVTGDKVAEVWSEFKRRAVGTFLDFRRKLRQRIPPSSRPAPRTEAASPRRESWLMREPKWFAAVLAFVVLAVVEVLSWEAANWPLCLLPSKYGAGGCATFLEGVAQFAVVLWDNADRNGVTAVAAIVIALFTWTLWRSSEKMWSVANAAANAAKRSADALVAAEQSQLLAICEITNITHILGERHDAPGSGEVPTGERALVQYVLKNYGKTPAVLKEISHDLQHWSNPPDELRYLPIRTMPKERAVVAGGSSEPLQCILVAPLTDAAAATIRTGDSFLWLYGRVVYDDAFGREREHRFLYRYRMGYGFQPHYYKDYNTTT